MAVRLRKEHFVEPEQYVLFVEDDKVKARNCFTQRIDFKERLDEAATVINNALSALAETGGGEVYIRDPMPPLKKKLIVGGSYATLRGSWRARLKLADGVNDTLLEVSNKTHVAIMNLFLDGNRANQTGISNALVLDSVDHVLLSGLRIINALNEGIYAYPMATPYCGVINIRDCWVTGCGDAGIWCNATDSFISDCDLGQNNYGLVLEGWTNKIMGSHFWGNLYDGLVIKKSYHSRIIGNRIDYNKRRGIIGEAGIREMIIANNHIYMNSQEAPNTYDGLTIVGTATDPTRNILIKGNRIGTSYETETQRNNIDIEGGANTTYIAILDNMLLNYRNKPLWFDGDWATSRIKRNIGFVTENGGVASVADGGIIPHGLNPDPIWAGRPVSVELTPAVARRIAGCTGIDGANLTISLHDDAGTPITVAESVRWRAEVW